MDGSRKIGFARKVDPLTPPIRTDKTSLSIEFIYMLGLTLAGANFPDKIYCKY